MISRNEPSFFAADSVAQLLQLLPTLPAAGSLHETCIRTIGTYSNWLNKNPGLLPSLLAFVANGLAHEPTAAAASSSMKQLCDLCAEHLTDPAMMSQVVMDW